MQELLKTSRLVVLTGPGGSGKTRLAVEASRERIDSYRDGVWFVELGLVSEPSPLIDSIADGLGADMGLDRSPTDILKNFLADRHLLLLLDNFEHLL